MEISGRDTYRAVPERLKTHDLGAQSIAFQQTLQTAQQDQDGVETESGATPSTSVDAAAVGASGRESGLLAARFNHNGEDVGFDELPADVQQWFREVDEKSRRDDAYRAKVANDPNVGPVAKLRPFDPELDGWAMKRLAAMEPSTAQMTPQEYYNYMGSDREKYDALIQKAESPAYLASSRIFGIDLEQESKAAMLRDLQAEGSPLPETYGEFEQAWLDDLVRQQALAQERQHLLGLDRQIRG